MTSFPYRLLPVSPDNGWELPDHWVWDGSVVRGDDGWWHLFASIWSKDLPFHPNWVTNSRIVRAVSRTPEGPYQFAGEVLEPRGGDWWDGHMTHNPSVLRVEGRWLLYYTGTTYDGEAPSGPATEEMREQARLNQRIGLAWAPAPDGPWTRSDEPILLPRDGHWDSAITNNPAPCIRPDGSVLMLYKSTDESRVLRYGVAVADDVFGPYRRAREDPIVWRADADASYEDGFVWWQDDRYHLLFNDMTGALTGEDHGGGYGWSDDGISWHLGDPARGYSRQVTWADGSRTTQGSLERVQLIFDGGQPTHLVCATADGPGGWHRASRTWNVVIPLGS